MVAALLMQGTGPQARGPAQLHEEPSSDPGLDPSPNLEQRFSADVPGCLPDTLDRSLAAAAGPCRTFATHSVTPRGRRPYLSTSSLPYLLIYTQIEDLSILPAATRLLVTSKQLLAQRSDHILHRLRAYEAVEGACEANGHLAR